MPWQSFEEFTQFTTGFFSSKIAVIEHFEKIDQLTIELVSIVKVSFEKELRHPSFAFFCIHATAFSSSPHTTLETVPIDHQDCPQEC